MAHTGAGTRSVTVRYFAGARAAAGLEEEVVHLDGAGRSLTVAALADLLAERHGAELARVLTASSFLVDEVASGRDRVVHDGAQVDVLPPFAGG